MEHYGDPHLHYEGYPEYTGYKSAGCKWNANAQAPYDVYVPETPLYPQKCHVEYCHPGTWQMSAQGPPPVMVSAAAAPAPESKPMMMMPMMPSMNTSLSTTSMMYGIGGVALAFLVLFLLRKRLMK
jgi:uncharacterized membrane protein